MLNLNSLFAKILALLMFAVSFIVPGNPEKLDISVNVTTTEQQMIYVEWKNNTGKAITEPTYYIEKLENGKWQEVEFAEGFGFPEIYTQHYPTEGGKITVNVQKDLKEPLTEGKYRITLCYELLYCNTKNGCANIEFEVS